MTTGLLVLRLVNELLGLQRSFGSLAIFMGRNGWFQSFGALQCCVIVTLVFGGKKRGSNWGCGVQANNIGEALPSFTAFICMGGGGEVLAGLGFRAAGNPA